MKHSRYSEEQVAYALRQVEAGTPVGDVCRQLGVSEATFYTWKKKYAHLGVSELRRPLRQMLGRPSVAGWNDHVCPGQAAAAQLLRDTAEWVDLGADEAATTRSL
jgi:transposase-like protein